MKSNKFWDRVSVISITVIISIIATQSHAGAYEIREITPPNGVTAEAVAISWTRIDVETEPKPDGEQEMPKIEIQDPDVDRALEILDRLKAQYPSGTKWDDTFENYYHYSTYSQAVKSVAWEYTTYNPEYENDSEENNTQWAAYGPLDTRTACGGWAAMVSDLIFGLESNPPREVQDLTQARPGDIVIMLDENDYLRHIAIITSNGTETAFDDDNRPFDAITYCDGNNSDSVQWPVGYKNMINVSPGAYRDDVWAEYKVFTRYPD